MRLKTTLFFALIFICYSGKTQENRNPASLEFDIKKAEYLYHFAYECIDQEYPNKLNQVLGDDSYLAPPRTLHPAFYGCFDWHSSVHGHWALVTILKEFPDFQFKDEIIEKLKKNITKENIQREIEYFDDKHNKTYERTYGWAWLLKLDEALQEWDSPESLILHENLNPLVDLISVLFRVSVMGVSPFTFVNRSAANCWYSSFSSMPIYFLSCSNATCPVVADPEKGSSTVLPSGHPAKMQGSISLGGKVAKCAPL